jgi:hypothetical protein
VGTILWNQESPGHLVGEFPKTGKSVGEKSDTDDVCQWVNPVEQLSQHLAGQGRSSLLPQNKMLPKAGV